MERLGNLLIELERSAKELILSEIEGQNMHLIDLMNHLLQLKQTRDITLEIHRQICVLFYNSHVKKLQLSVLTRQ